jgi:hypothetical protein
MVSLNAHAERKYGRAGCGLGSLVFAPTSSQSSAASSNGTGGQTFAITSGTSNCNATGRKISEQKQEDFFIANFATLSKEIAQGRGDAIVGFAGTLGCSPGHVKDVAATLQANYGQIFAAPGAVAAFDVAKDSLLDTPEVASHCAEL